MSDKPDLSELFQMLAEEKAKAAEKQEKKKKKSKEYKQDFIEAFSYELKKLKKEEEQQKRDIAAMEAWLTSPVVEKDEKPELEVEVADEPAAPTEEELEAVEQVLEEDKEILEELAETPLQEQALTYLNDRREELSEEAKQIKSIKKEMGSFSDQLTKLRLLLQNVGGGGIVKLRQADDIDTSTALVNNKFLKYDSTTGKFVGADASGGGGGISNVVEDTTPQLGGSLDLNSNDITGTGDIDITGEITANEFIGEFRGPLIFKAQADGALSKGDVVFVSGISGNTPTVAKADADDVTKMPAFGLAHDAAIDNAAVDVVTFGTLPNLDTSSFTVGDTLYVSTTAGALTNSAPTGESSYIQNIGKVQRAHATAGSIKVGGAGRFNATGNLNDGNIFIGNSSNQASTASLETEVHSLLGTVGVSIIPDTTETYDLGSSSLRWNDLFLAGNTIDLGGTKISKDSNGDVELKDSGDNLKKIIVDELHIGTGANKLKLTRDANGKLKALDNSDAKASHDVAFSELTGTPTTIAGYGITDAFDGAYSSLTGAPTIPTVDSTSVTAAGALMDSEVTNLAQVKAFDSSDYATAAQGAKADTALQSFTETNDLSAAVVWANVPNANITEGSVTQHQAALSITESQISDLGSYITNSVTNTSTDAIMTFTTTEDSSGAGPVIDLKRNSSSPADGDYIGQLKFRGENDADQDVIYAKLTGKISDASDGTEDGLIEITVKNGGSNRIVARFTGNDLKLLNSAGIDVASGGTINGELASTATATTASTGDDSTKIATTAFVKQEIDALKATLYAFGD